MVSGLSARQETENGAESVKIPMHSPHAWLHILGVTINRTHLRSSLPSHAIIGDQAPFRIHEIDDGGREEPASAFEKDIPGSQAISTANQRSASALNTLDVHSTYFSPQ